MVLDIFADDPILTAIVLTLLALVFGGYFFLRRIVVASQRGYQEGKRG